MKKIGKFICFALGTGMAFSLSACGGNGGSSNGSGSSGGAGVTNPGNVTLTIWCSKEDQSFAREVASAYQAANPDKTYRFQYGEHGENDIPKKILNDVEAAPDVFSFASDQIATLVNGDALARIGGDRLTALKNSNSAGAVDSATVTVGTEERTYAYPYTDNTFFLYYNKSIFNESDVATLDGILAKCSSSRRFAMALNDGWYATSFYFGKGLGYEVTYDDALAEKTISCDFGNDTGKAVTGAIWKLVSDNRVKADADDSKINAGFQDGSVAAAVTGIWNRGSIESYLGDNFGVAKLPSYTLDGEQVQLVSFAGYKLFGVGNYSKNKAEAMKFAEFYTNKENQLKHFEARGFVPTNTEARSNARVQADPCAKAITEQLPHSKVQKNVPSTLWVPFEGLGNAMITAASKGENFDIATQLAACVKGIEKK